MAVAITKIVSIYPKPPSIKCLMGIPYPPTNVPTIDARAIETLIGVLNTNAPSINTVIIDTKIINSICKITPPINNKGENLPYLII